MINNGTKEDAGIYAYIDDLTITQTEPATHAQGMVYRGVQDKITADPENAEAQVLNVRLVTTLDVTTYSAAGIAVKISTTEGVKQALMPITKAYSSLLGGSIDSELVYKASYYNAGAICALTVGNLPTSGTVTIEFTPYVGTLEALPTSFAHSVTYVDGVLQR